MQTSSDIHTVAVTRTRTLTDRDKKAVMSLYEAGKPMTVNEIWNKSGVHKTTFSRSQKDNNRIGGLVKEVTGNKRHRKYELNELGLKIGEILRQKKTKRILGEIDDDTLLYEMENKEKTPYIEWKHKLWIDVHGAECHLDHNVIIFTGRLPCGPFSDCSPFLPRGVGDLKLLAHPVKAGFSLHPTLGTFKPVDGALKQVEEKVHETHGIHTQSWSVQAEEIPPWGPESGTIKFAPEGKVTIERFDGKKIEIDREEYFNFHKNTNVLYASGLGAKNLEAALRKMKAVRKVAWVIFTMDWVMYIISGELGFLEIEAFVPYISPNKEFVSFPLGASSPRTVIPEYDFRGFDEFDLIPGLEAPLRYKGHIKGEGLGELETKRYLKREQPGKKFGLSSSNDYTIPEGVVYLFEIETDWKKVYRNCSITQREDADIVKQIKHMNPPLLIADVERGSPQDAKMVGVKVYEFQPEGLCERVTILSSWVW